MLTFPCFFNNLRLIHIHGCLFLLVALFRFDVFLDFSARQITLVEVPTRTSIVVSVVSVPSWISFAGVLHFIVAVHIAVLQILGVLLGSEYLLDVGEFLRLHLLGLLAQLAPCGIVAFLVVLLQFGQVALLGIVFLVQGLDLLLLGVGQVQVGEEAVLVAVIVAVTQYALIAVAVGCRHALSLVAVGCGDALSLVAVCGNAVVVLCGRCGCAAGEHARYS